MDDECVAVCGFELAEIESRSGGILDSVEESGGWCKQKEDSFCLQKLGDRFRRLKGGVTAMDSHGCRRLVMLEVVLATENYLVTRFGVGASNSLLWHIQRAQQTCSQPPRDKSRTREDGIQRGQCEA